MKNDTETQGADAIASKDLLGEIFVIHKLWTDSMENHYSAALGYEVIGFVKTKADAEKLVADAGFRKGGGWPIGDDQQMPILKAQCVQLISPNS